MKILLMKAPIVERFNRTLQKGIDRILKFSTHRIINIHTFIFNAEII